MLAEAKRRGRAHRQGGRASAREKLISPGGDHQAGRARGRGHHRGPLRRTASGRIRLGAEDYADEILNTLEINLTKFIGAVQRGPRSPRRARTSRPRSPSRGAGGSRGGALWAALRAPPKTVTRPRLEPRQPLGLLLDHVGSLHHSARSAGLAEAARGATHGLSAGALEHRTPPTRRTGCAPTPDTQPCRSRARLARGVAEGKEHALDPGPWTMTWRRTTMAGLCRRDRQSRTTREELALAVGVAGRRPARPASPREQPTAPLAGPFVEEVRSAPSTLFGRAG